MYEDGCTRVYVHVWSITLFIAPLMPADNEQLAHFKSC